MKKKKHLPWSLFATCAVATAAFVGIANYVQSVRTKPIEDPTSHLSQNQGIKKDLSVKVDDSKLSLTELQSSITKQVGKDLADSGFSRIRILGSEISDHNAILDVNPAISSGFGSEEEAQFLEVIKKSLSKYSTVNTFQLRLDGKVLDALSHVEIGVPNPVR